MKLVHQLKADSAHDLIDLVMPLSKQDFSIRRLVMFGTQTLNYEKTIYQAHIYETETAKEAAECLNKV